MYQRQVIEPQCFSSPLCRTMFRSRIWNTKSGRGLVVRVLDSRQWGHRINPHTGRGSLLKPRQFHLPQFASVYSAANEYQHCCDDSCDELASCPGQSVQLHSTLAFGCHLSERHRRRYSLDRYITKRNCEHYSKRLTSTSSIKLDVSSIDAVRDAAVRKCGCSARA